MSGWRWIGFNSPDEDDYRPVKVLPPGPWWCSGYGDGYCTMVAWWPADRDIADLGEWWPGFTLRWPIDEEPPVERPTFVDRFPKPDGWDEANACWPIDEHRRVAKAWPDCVSSVTAAALGVSQ